MASIKTLVQSQDLKSLPSEFAHFKDTQESIRTGPEVSVPVIDFSLLSSTDPDERAKVILDLGKACEEWGFFLVINQLSSPLNSLALIENLALYVCVCMHACMHAP